MLLKILFAHALGDYFLQSNYLAMNKGKDNYLLCIHAILYTFAVSLIFGNEISQLWYWLILLIVELHNLFHHELIVFHNQLF